MLTQAKARLFFRGRKRGNEEEKVEIGQPTHCSTVVLHMSRRESHLVSLLLLLLFHLISSHCKSPLSNLCLSLTLFPSLSSTASRISSCSILTAKTLIYGYSALFKVFCHCLVVMHKRPYCIRKLSSFLSALLLLRLI